MQNVLLVVFVQVDLVKIIISYQKKTITSSRLMYSPFFKTGQEKNILVFIVKILDYRSLIQLTFPKPKVGASQTLSFINLVDLPCSSDKYEIQRIETEKEVKNSGKILVDNGLNTASFHHFFSICFPLLI
ncbi:hypothetical protein EL23_18335 [Paenibacillus polymyxa]|nr:hypothetical protein EL23_18335 [Paenibacillus polymyxa]